MRARTHLSLNKDALASRAVQDVGRIVPWIGYYDADRPQQDAQRSLCYAGNRVEIGGVIEPRIHLSQAAKLSRKPEPPLSGFAQTGYLFSPVTASRATERS